MQAWLTENYPLMVTAIVLVFFLWLAHVLLIARQKVNTEAKIPRQLIMLVLTVVALIILILEIPVSETSRGQLLSLIGIVITGVLAISSTTFVANALGGLMLRVMGSFQPGDFIRVGEQFGRVTERGLFHIEIQTEDRDLSTLPNLYLITNPVTVVHGSGTMISSNISLGYDIPHTEVEELLQKAALETGLEDPFVFVSELGDYSVSYQVYGFLTEVKQLLSAKSNLRRNMLDALHNNGIEIVSPSYMNQRQLQTEAKIIPSLQKKKHSKKASASQPEDLIFDKAEKASELEGLRKDLDKLKNSQDEKLTTESHGSEKNTAKIHTIENRIEALNQEIKAHTDKSD